jgi:hypothetical protein
VIGNKIKNLFDCPPASLLSRGTTQPQSGLRPCPLHSLNHSITVRSILLQRLQEEVKNQSDTFPNDPSLTDLVQCGVYWLSAAGGVEIFNHV